MLMKYWKNFKWFLFIPLILFVFFLNIKNVNAYVYKKDIWNPMNQYTISGSLNSNSSTTINFDINGNTLMTQSQNYDILVFKFNRFELKTTDNISITGLVGDNGGQQTTHCSPQSNGSYNCSATSVLNTQGTSLTTNIVQGNYYIQGALYYNNNVNNKSLCFLSSELQDMFLCPINKEVDKQITDFELILSNGGYDTFNYYIELSGLKYGFNYETTDITLQQQTTNTNLQYIYTQQQQQGQYMQNDSTTGATTQMTGDFSDLATSFNSELQGVNDLSQLVLLPISLFMDLSTDNCQPLHLVVPFVNTSVDLPCMKAIFNTFFSGFYSIFTTIMSAVICYWVAVKSGALIKEIVDCDNDRIEVVDL